MIPEVIVSEKFYINMSPIPNGFGAMCIWNLVRARDVHEKFLQNELLAPLENVPFQTQLQMYY
jgi:hypothetical protein